MNITPLMVALHTDEQNPIFGEQTIHIEIVDEAAGPFLKISQDNEFIHLTLEELDLVNSQAKKIISTYKRNFK